MFAAVPGLAALHAPLVMVVRSGRGDRGRERGGGERVGGDAVGGDRAARVEAVPADPEHAGADHGQHQAVRRMAPCRNRALAQMMHSTSADQPEVMCTTVPPAKSIALIFALAFQTPFIRPSMPQTMWAIGK